MFSDTPWINQAAKVLIVLVIAWIVAKIFRVFLNRMVKKSSADLNVDPTKFFFFKNAINGIIILAAVIIIFYSIPALRDIGISLFAGAGILAAIIGFASQQAFSNIVSGVFIIIFKPFKVGDIIKFGASHFGKIEDITLRHTVIMGLENRRLVVPNSVISQEVILNSSIVEESICNFIEVGISYDSDIDLAMRLMREEAKKHRFYLDKRSQEDIDAQVDPVVVRVIGFGDSSVNLRAQVWSEDPIKGFEMKCDLFKSIKERFDKEGIEIPFPYRTIVYKEPQSAHQI